MESKQTLKLKKITEVYHHPLHFPSLNSSLFVCERHKWQHQSVKCEINCPSQPSSKRFLCKFHSRSNTFFHYLIINLFNAVLLSQLEFLSSSKHRSCELIVQVYKVCCFLNCEFFSQILSMLFMVLCLNILLIAANYLRSALDFFIPWQDISVFLPIFYFKNLRGWVGECWLIIRGADDLSKMMCNSLMYALWCNDDVRPNWPECEREPLVNTADGVASLLT